MDARTTAENILNEELGRLKERIIANHIAAGQRASGRTIESIVVHVESTPDGASGELDARAYFAGLETGSRPWSRIHTRLRKDGSEYPSAPKWFIEVVEGWAATKGVNLDSPCGSALFRDGGRDDIFSNEIPVAFDNVASRLAGLFDVQLTESILRTINN